MLKIIPGRKVKKNTLNHLFFILILGIIVNADAMLLPKRPLKMVSPRTTYTPTTFQQPKRYHTKAYQPLTWTDQFKQFSNRFRQFLFGPEKTHQENLDEVNAVIEKIKNKQTNYISAFDEFLQKNKQPHINTFLSRLVFSENKLDLLNARVFTLHLGLALGNKSNQKLIKKITLWAKNNINHLFGLNLHINEEFFLFELLQLDYKQELIYALKESFPYITQRPAGEKFISLLQKTNKEVYDQIVPHDQIITSAVKNSLDQDKDMLINKE